MAEIIQFPEATFILRCHKCKTNAFYIYLNTKDHRDIAGYECSECGAYTTLEDENKALNTSEG